MKRTMRKMTMMRTMTTKRTSDTMDENLAAEMECNYELNTACGQGLSTVVEMMDDLGYDTTKFKVTVHIEQLNDCDADWKQSWNGSKEPMPPSVPGKFEQ